ncbi:MAG: hypothetical protein KDA58_08665 [Planctomycetaceae bacterium]|nr:hypothetical protein [Planctomycetaceae bacterium]
MNDSIPLPFDEDEFSDELTSEGFDDSIEDSLEEEEYEEIDSEEVDRVVAVLESLIESTTSENIRAYLDEAAENIYELVYNEEHVDWEDGPDHTAEAA